jgi:hypothetical protein
MIPLSKSATIPEDANLYEAVFPLEEAQSAQQEYFYKLRGLLVINKKEQVVGKINPLDFILGIKDNYRKVGDLRSVTHTGFTREFISMMIERNRLWQDPLVDLCKKAARHQVAVVMDKPTPGEYIEEEEFSEFCQGLQCLPYSFLCSQSIILRVILGQNIFVCPGRDRDKQKLFSVPSVPLW